MSSKEKLFHIIFWACAFIAWIFWLQDRIQLFSWFVDGYKDLGYVVTTNDKQLGWYIILSVIRGGFLIVVLYFLGEKLSITKKEVLTAPFWLGGFLTLDYLVSKGYFLLLSDSAEEGFRLVWDYDFFAILGIYFSLLLVGWVLKSARNWIAEFNNLKSLHQTQQSYQALQRQLNPHFLFNTVNNIYEIAVDEGNERMQNSILNLTKTLRYTIDYSNNDTVSLGKEIEAIQSFIGLQKERFDAEDLNLSTAFEVENPELKIRPMILLNFIENAFHHGYKFDESSSILIRLSQKGTELSLQVDNTNHAQRVNKDGGNEKTKKILELSYPGNHILDIKDEKAFYKLNLWIQLG